jgi:hypothetical protein
MQEGNNCELESVSGSNNGTHFTQQQQQKKLNCSFHYESSVELDDRTWPSFMPTDVVSQM